MATKTNPVESGVDSQRPQPVGQKSRRIDQKPPVSWSDLPAEDIAWPVVADQELPESFGLARAPAAFQSTLKRQEMGSSVPSNIEGDDDFRIGICP